MLLVGLGLSKISTIEAPLETDSNYILAQRNSLLWQARFPIPVPRILARIADCESGGEHYNQDGSVKLGRINPNDTGLYQINKIVWGSKAEELGYDIYAEQDNEKMARWIYDNYGTEPWRLSKNCWQ